jgi:RHS repeat-associated protein
MTDESDLYYMRARYYNPVAKRFISPDTLMGGITNPQSQNRYTYCKGNPANYVDPTGFNDTAGLDPLYDHNLDKFNYVEAWEYFKPNEMDVAWFQAGGPGAPETGVAGYAIFRIAGKETSQKLLRNILGEIINKAGKAYPKVIDPRTEKYIFFPDGELKRVPIEQRVNWDMGERADYIREWYNRGYQTPEGGWDGYDIHHILPREFGGDNSFDNLVPIKREIHPEFNEFWRDY